jgi:hypothetical protein
MNHRAILSASILALPLLAFPANADSYKRVRDVDAWCNNALRCEMTLSGNGGPVWSVELSRPSGPGSAAEMRIGAQADAAGGPVVVAVDGQAILRFAAGDLPYSQEDSRFLIEDEGDVAALLDAMKKGGRVSVSTKAGSGDFSLSGVVGALIWIDETQQRLDSVDALQVVGDKPSSAPRFDEVLDIAVLPASIARDFAEGADCAFFDPASFRFRGGFSAPVGSGLTIYGLPCSEGGAYNQSYAFYAGSGESYSRLVFPAFGEKGPVSETTAWNVSWNHAERTLEAFFKGRGIGDCGGFTRWRFDDNGPRFELVEQRVKDDCDGDAAGGPQNWPLVWPR